MKYPSPPNSIGSTNWQILAKVLHLAKQMIFNPTWPLYFYSFLSITNLHAQVPILTAIHVESLTLAAVVIMTLVQIFLIDKIHMSSNLNLKNPMLVPTILCIAYVLSPLFSSFSNSDYLKIAEDEEYLTLVKMLIFTPCLFYFLSTQEKFKKQFLSGLILFYVIFAINFLYRYLILNEIRLFDQRPSLKIRNGDPNFLCTFFSMMIPIAFFKAWEGINSRRPWIVLVGFLAGLILLACAFLTESRMGILATLVGLFYLITRPIWPIRRNILLLITIATISIGVTLGGQRILDRFNQIEDKSNSDRLLTFKNGLLVFADKPFFGAGMHKAKLTFYQNTGFPNFQSEAKPLEVHNTFLKVAAELGLFGFFVFFSFFAWATQMTWKSKSKEACFFFASLIILFLSSLTIGVCYKDLIVFQLILVAGFMSSFQIPPNKYSRNS